MATKDMVHSTTPGTTATLKNNITCKALNVRQYVSIVLIQHSNLLRCAVQYLLLLTMPIVYSSQLEA